MHCRRLSHLVDHLVGASQQRRRDGEAEHFCGGQIDNEIKLGRLLDWNVGGLGPVQNLIDQLGGAVELVREIWPVGHESPSLDKVASTEDCRQPRTERQRKNSSAVGGNESILRDVKCIRLGLERLEGGTDILRSSNFEWRDFEAERASRSLNLAHL